MKQTQKLASGAAPYFPPEPCPLCGGTGCEEGCGLRGGCEMAHAGPESHKVCRRCGGSGEAS